MADIKTEAKRFFSIRWTLVLYDVMLFVVSAFLLVVLYHKYQKLTVADILINSALACFSIILCRLFGNIYRQIWRYGGIEGYMKLLAADLVGGILYICLSRIMTYAVDFTRLTFARSVALM